MKQISKSDRERYEYYIGKASDIELKLRGANRALVYESAKSKCKADDVNHFCSWLVENGYLKYDVVYLPQAQVKGFEDDGSYTFGWTIKLPKELQASFPGCKHLIVLNFKRWMVVLHELAHAQCTEYRVKFKKNAEHNEEFYRALRNIVKGFREYCREYSS
jgi:hypothetical protein